MKSSNKMASDFFKVVLSNATVLASSIITALIIPKLMGASNYGYYKVYTLYMSYTHFFTLVLLMESLKTCGAGI